MSRRFHRVSRIFIGGFTTNYGGRQWVTVIQDTKGSLHNKDILFNYKWILSKFVSLVYYAYIVRHTVPGDRPSTTQANCHVLSFSYNCRTL